MMEWQTGIHTRNKHEVTLQVVFIEMNHGLVSAQRRAQTTVLERELEKHQSGIVLSITTCKCLP